MGYEQLGGRLCCHASAGPGLLREFRRRLTRWLEQAGVSDQARHAILLAAHEAAAHGIEHAARERPITVLGRVEQDAILIEVMSAGAWGAHPQPASDERGRGLILMKKLVSAVEIVAEAERTTVRLRWIRGERHKGNAEAESREPPRAGSARPASYYKARLSPAARRSR